MDITSLVAVVIILLILGVIIHLVNSYYPIPTPIMLAIGLIIILFILMWVLGFVGGRPLLR